MATPDPGRATTLPLDELALEVLADLVARNEWNEYNYLNSASQDGRYRGQEAALHAIAEALTWLRNRGFIAHTPGQTADAAIFVTRAGHAVLKKGLQHARAEARLQEGLYPLLERRCRRQFLLGEYEQAVFVAMKSVEVRVRELAGLGEDSTGVDLMNRAFGPKGVLTDTSAVKGEQEGTRMLFAGAYATLRNPSGHREIDYDDVAEAAEAVTTASLLMRILDRVERRVASDGG
ncbi:MAG TPA: TIGR02391 family protein [Acidimicrobiales bacterium]|nr:TIGR02391 family protein [Acidimicrobiales bacterium]